MIYANPPKVDREKWPTAPPPSYYSRSAAKEWCRRYESDGHFYFHYTNTRWWFEKEEDAVLFALTWSGR